MGQAIRDAAVRPDRRTPLPYMFRLDLLAARYGIPPWTLDTDDPVVSRWVTRGLIFMDLEKQGKARKE